MTATPAPSAVRRSAILLAGIALLGTLAACSDDSTDNEKTAEEDVTTFASAHCDAGVECTSPEVSLGDTTLSVTAAASEFSQTVSVELVDDQELTCAAEDAATGGAMAIFSNTVPDAAKTITYTLTGDAADQARTSFEDHPEYFGCYGAPQAFTGFTGRDAGAATFDRESKMYVAALLPCDDVKTTPCFSVEDGDGSVTITVEAPAGDPRFW